MTIFVADHTGRIATSSPRLRPIHVGAALSDPSRVGNEPDTTVPASLSAFPVFADLRLYDYISKAYAGRCDYVCIQQYRRLFFLGRPRLWQRTLGAMELSAAQTDEGQVTISERERDLYLRHLAKVSDETLRAELGRHSFVANRWSFGTTTVEDQYLGSIADTYPGQPAYIDAWHDMRSALERRLGPGVVGEALHSTSGYFNNCFVASWDEFQLYNGFLFDVLDELRDYRDVHRLYGYLAERIFCVYVAHQSAARGDFRVRSKPMMLVGEPVAETVTAVPQSIGHSDPPAPRR